MLPQLEEAQGQGIDSETVLSAEQALIEALTPHITPSGQSILGGEAEPFLGAKGTEPLSGPEVVAVLSIFRVRDMLTSADQLRRSIDTGQAASWINGLH
ncbi:hypothetical protein M3A96_10775 [Helcobacillus massiliensis]|uniref:hypothetical protein n=1 Tax=Helcobacillus massiliensis TaxID=521392 RepID=UPI0021A9229B|nr:hypothetical protein [Helcobacillus massiliensis]MCT1558596.1 hypothetical protein [Helcobacillus massiliensis]MCT2037427.1 hypothetical protein [Helcobacillus massiliensis]MCT2332786.1 hypothetical protein [Helcobacillus massiliensis]